MYTKAPDSVHSAGAPTAVPGDNYVPVPGGAPTLGAIVDKMIVHWETRFGSPTSVELVGSRVSQIKDLSGNGHHSDVNAVDGSRPAWNASGGINDSPYISLPRIGDTLINTSVARPAGGRYHFFAIARLPQGSGAKFPGRSGSLFHIRSQEIEWSWSGQDESGNQSGPDGTVPLCDHVWHLVEEAYYATGWKARVDGIDAVPNFTDSDPAGAIVSIEVGLGSLTASGGDFAAFWVFDEPLSAEDREIFLAYIRYWYGGTSVRGAWTWFTHPRAVRYASGGVDRTFIGVVTDRGEVAVIQRDHATGVTTRGVIQSGFEVDDHNNPSLLVRSSDQRLIAMYSEHVASNAYYVAISTNPLDATSWGAPVNLHSVLQDTQYTYANLIELDDGIYNFYRGASLSQPGTISDWFYTKSTNQGATWGARVQFMTAVETPVHGRPYLHFRKMSGTRIDVFCSEDHPAEAPDLDCSLYHCYWEDGEYFQSDGTSIGTDAPVPQDCTLVWDGNAGEAGWNWELSDDGEGNPIVLFATFPGSPAIPTDHRYRFGKWNGSAWETYQIATAGTHLYYDNAAPHYSGGICFDGPSAVYCSRETGALTWELYRYVTADGGATWTLDSQITSGTGASHSNSRVNIRPVVPLGGGHSELPVVWMFGRYRAYVKFATQVRAINDAVLPTKIALAD